MDEHDQSFEGRPELPAEHVSRVLEVVRALNAPHHLQRLLKAAAQKTAQLCGVERCSIYLWRDGKLHPSMSQFASGVPASQLWNEFIASGPHALDELPACKRALATGALVVVDGVADANLLTPEWAERFKSRGMVIVPLLRGDEPVGVMVLDDKTAPISDVALSLADLIGRQLAPVIDHRRVVAELRRRLFESNRLVKVGLIFDSTLELHEVMRRIARESARAAGADTAGIYLIAEHTRMLHPLVGYHVPKSLLDAVQSGRLNLADFHQLGARFKHGRRSVWSENVAGDPHFDHAIFRQLKMQSLFLTLLKAGGEVLGVLICVWWTKRARFRPATLRLLEGIANHAALALGNARLYRQAEVAVINRERNRLSRSLHDALNQTVFSAALKLDVCLNGIPSEMPGLRAELETVKRSIGMIMGQIRQFVGELAPEHLVAMRFSERVRVLIEEAIALSGIRVDFVEDGDSAVLAPSQQDILLKTFQETLANVIKHSGASRAEVRLQVLGDDVRFAVTDNGVGTQPGLSVDRLGQLAGHFGLQQIVSHIAALGGEVELGNAMPSGFFVRGRLRIKHSPPGER